MKTLIISSAELSLSAITPIIQQKGYGVTEATSTDEAVNILGQGHFNMICIAAGADTAENRKTINFIRRHTQKYTYIVSISSTPRTDLGDGANTHAELDMIDAQMIDTLTRQAENLDALVEIIGNNNIDFPSAGGIIARSAFNQLFLSALDRSNRHAELSSILMIELDNYQELFNIGGNYIADYAVAALSKKLVDIRRQSDIIGQIKNQTFALLLQMPQNQQEPIDAATRFARTLKEDPSLKEATPTPMGIKVSLISVPNGEKRFEEFVVPEQDKTSAHTA